MTEKEQVNKVHELVEEYWGISERAEVEDYRKRVNAFFNDNDVADDAIAAFMMSGVGSSFYMAYGVEIDDSDTAIDWERLS